MVPLAGITPRYSEAFDSVESHGVNPIVSAICDHDPSDGKPAVHRKVIRRKPGSSRPKLLQGDTLRVLYLFAGVKRKSDIASFLEKETSRRLWKLELKEVDLLQHGEEDDVLDDQVWEAILKSIREGYWHGTVGTPPCNSFSRVLSSNYAGPQPVRSRAFPYGFPWLFGKDKARCVTGNVLAYRSLEAFRAGHKSVANTPYLLEHPEDLGTTRNGDEPASLFQWEDTVNLIKDTAAIQGALYQCRHPGAMSAKPTRLVGTFRKLRKLLALGPPTFNKHGKYTGPLPKSCGHKDHAPLVGQKMLNGTKVFQTYGSSNYPAGMNEDLAAMICEEYDPSSSDEEDLNKEGSKEVGLSPCGSGVVSRNPPPFSPPLSQPSSEDTGKAQPQVQPDEGPVTSDEDEDGVTRPKLGEGIRGTGSPAWVEAFGKWREFHDGGGLCSTGRWPPNQRNVAAGKDSDDLGAQLKSLIWKVVGEMNPQKFLATLACGKVKSSPFTEAQVAEGRNLLGSWLKNHHEEPTLAVHDGQPFTLHLLASILKVIGDPDWRFLCCSSDPLTTGVNIGAKKSLPRTPAVFERKVKWKVHDEDLCDGFPESKDNYVSVKNNVGSIEKQFREEESEGLMAEVPILAAESEFGEDLLFAALAGIEKSDESFRVIHDGTHGVKVNQRIKPRDQCRFPGIAEKKFLMRRASSMGFSAFGLKADISKAHRRVKVRRQDVGLQACQLRPDTVWLNLVGTFGIGSASYWWQRIAAAISRVGLVIVGRHEFWQLIYADDYDWMISGPDMATNVLVVVFFYVLVGMPFAWHKCGGGFAYEWIGYWQDYTTFSVGVSEARSKWLCTWIKESLAQGSVLVRNMSEVLGRFGFAAGAIDHFRPFLGPFYAWVSSVPLGAVLEIPIMLKVLLNFLLKVLESGGFMMDCSRPIMEGTAPDSFRADAMAEDGRAAMGGWCCADNPDPFKCRWYFLEFTKENAPWAFKHGSDQLFRFIASLELMATLVCVHLFGDPKKDQTLTLSGSTDNMGNSFIVKKFMTTKFPVCCILMQLAETLQKKGQRLSLAWLPRDDNELADAISKQDFEAFDPALRIEVDLDEFAMMQQLITTGEGLYDEVKRRKLCRPRSPVRSRATKKIKTRWG